MTKILNSNVDKLSSDGESPVRLCNYVDVYYNDEITDDLQFMSATASPDEIARFGLRGGDVLLTKDSESWTDIAVTAFVPETLDDVVCGYHLAILRSNPDQLNPRFLKHALSADAVNHQFQVGANGITRYGLGHRALGDATIPVPPLDEQRAIAAFLDERTAEIDALVEREQRLIELLRERRAAIITRAVTRGLDPSAPLRDSGFEWIGQVPAHWQVTPLRRHLREHLQYGANASGDPLVNGPRFVRITDISGGRLRDDTAVYLGDDEAAPYILADGDLLLARSGATVGKSFLYDDSWGPCCFAGYLIRCRTDAAKLRPRYLAYYTETVSYWAWIRRNGIQATIENVSAERYAGLAVPVPSTLEQDQIVSELDAETFGIDALIETAADAMSRLREYRKALTTAAVTGQIDVRDEVAAG